MKLSNEYRRKVDPMSRVTIPADIREALDIQCGDDVIVSLSDDGVIAIQKETNRCTRCESQKDLIGIEIENPTTHICADCIGSMHLLCQLYGLT